MCTHVTFFLQISPQLVILLGNLGLEDLDMRAIG